ncbi:hypothetical protein BB561_004826 [Smittium simulii]|uniref:Uncharacterized protein n=1 Tax=Smittium simulii TaxID=133385 RepID=A0A2T9YDW7_9FUNG|nr:hypothetical protein BB561_004826 [Smittium simulii]
MQSSSSNPQFTDSCFPSNVPITFESPHKYSRASASRVSLGAILPEEILSTIPLTAETRITVSNSIGFSQTSLPISSSSTDLALSRDQFRSASLNQKPFHNDQLELTADFFLSPTHSPSEDVFEFPCKPIGSDRNCSAHLKQYLSESSSSSDLETDNIDSESSLLVSDSIQKSFQSIPQSNQYRKNLQDIGIVLFTASNELYI